MRVTGGIFLLWLISFLSAAENYSLYEENGKVGLKNQLGQVLIPAQYEQLGWSNSTFSVVGTVTGYLTKGQWGLVNLTNRKVTEAEFTALVPGEGLFLVASKRIGVSTRSSVGCINTNGKVIIPFLYDGLTIASLRAIVILRASNQYKYGLIDLDNKKIIPLEYKEIHAVGNLRYAVADFKNKTALFTEAGRQITPFSMDSVSRFFKNYAIIYQNYKQGLIDREGIVKIEPKYSSIEIQENEIIKGKLPDEWIFLDGKNQSLKQVVCDSIEGVEKNIYKIFQGGTIQLVNENLQPISEQTFSSLDNFEKGRAIFRREGKYGVLYQDGRIAIDARFDELIINKKYLLGNRKNQGRDQWTLLDSTGNKKHTKTYERIESFNGKFFPVKNRNHWGAIDENGKEIIACVHDSLLQYAGENIAVKFHNQYGIIDTKEEWIVIPLPNPIRLITETRYLEFSPQTTYLRNIDRSIIYFTTNRVEVFPDHLREYLPSGAIWKINFDGRIVSRQVQPDEPIEKVFVETEGLRAIKRDGKYGFIDSRGRLRIANRYDDAQIFSDNLAAIKIRGKWGFIDHAEKIVIQPAYDEVFPFQYGIAIVKQKGFFGAINKTGKVILYPRYDDLHPLPNHRLLIKIDGLQGLSDVDGKLLIGPKFNQLDDLDNGYVIIERNKKYGLLTLQGVSTIPMIYDHLSYDRYNGHYIASKKADWSILKP